MQMVLSTLNQRSLTLCSTSTRIECSVVMLSYMLSDFTLLQGQHM